eukprot:623183-Amorphochlora_amoeboformis.AAC.1
MTQRSVRVSMEQETCSRRDFSEGMNPKISWVFAEEQRAQEASPRSDFSSTAEYGTNLGIAYLRQRGVVRWRGVLAEAIAPE